MSTPAKPARRPTYVDLSDDDDDLPLTLDIALSLRRGRTPASATSVKRSDEDACVVNENQKGGAALWPPLPSTTNGNENDAGARSRRSITHISDSEDELPRLGWSEPSGGGASSPRRQSLSDRSLIEDSEDERLSTAASLRQTFGLENLQISYVPLYERGVGKADEGVRSARHVAPSTSTLPPRLPILESRTPTKPVQTVETIYVDDSEEENEAPVTPRASGKSRVSWSSDDEGAGVLVYQPTPVGRRPAPLKTFATPSRKTSRAPSKIRNEVILDSDSDSDNDRLITPIKPATTTRAPTPKSSRPTARPLRPPLVAMTPKRTDILSAAQRASLPLELVRELDRSVFRKKWDNCAIVDGDGPGLPEGIEIVWNARLRNTAGKASWKRFRVDGVLRHHCAIDLATKVTDTAEKLKHTLAHELCHIAAWILSDEIKPSHGPAFKLWAGRVMKVRPDVNITTTHSYEISYKFRWVCDKSPCGKIFSRHSNSIDPATHGCPCGGRLVPIDATGAPKTPRTPAKKTDYQRFVQEMTPRLKADSPGLKQSEILKAAAALWREKKQKAENSLSDSLRTLELNDSD